MAFQNINIVWLRVEGSPDFLHTSIITFPLNWNSFASDLLKLCLTIAASGMDDRKCFQSVE